MNNRRFVPGATNELPSPQPPSRRYRLKTTEGMVMLTAKQGVSRQQIVHIMPGSHLFVRYRCIYIFFSGRKTYQEVEK
jgi:hypothetical protein